MSVITLSVAAAAWGQTFESKEMPKNYDIIPKSLAYEGKSSIVIWSEDDENTVDIYDSNLEKVRSITITPSSAVYEFKTITQIRKTEKTDEWETISDESYKSSDLLPSIYRYEDYDNNIFLEEGFKFTQTLFNTDEKYEYIIPIYEEGESIIEYKEYGYDMRKIVSGTIQKGYKVVNEDGMTLCTLYGTFISPSDELRLYKIEDKTYLVFHDEYFNTWYRIDQQSSSIESVKRIPTGKSQIYSVDGRKLNNTQRGINIIRKDDGSSTKQLIR